jgi:hypothetical protein
MIPYDWNRFVNQVKKLIIIISQMGQNEIKQANDATLQKDYNVLLPKNNFFIQMNF